uniref:CX domain-containing protein n=1 Tax=Romanomermis culicivorax TaxID=13658 RepID=A0A915HPZ7_ROMCU
MLLICTMISFVYIFSTFVLLTDFSDCNYSSETTNNRLIVEDSSTVGNFADSGLIHLYQDIERIVRDLGGSTEGTPPLRYVSDSTRVSFNRTYFYDMDKFIKVDPNASICVYSIGVNDAYFNLVANDGRAIRKILYECPLGQNCCYGLICCDELVLAWWQIVLVVTGIIFGSIICCWFALCIPAHFCTPNREKTMETPDFHMSEMSTVSLSKYEANSKVLQQGAGRRDDDALFSLIANLKKADRKLMIEYKEQAAAAFPVASETKKFKSDLTPPTTTTSPSSHDAAHVKRMGSQAKYRPKLSKEASIQASLWKKSHLKT